ncbi:unnamed protein product, partial [Urochloa humidicola]
HITDAGTLADHAQDEAHVLWFRMSNKMGKAAVDVTIEFQNKQRSMCLLVAQRQGLGCYSLFFRLPCRLMVKWSWPVIS